MNGLALFAGVAGLELGIKMALGDEYRTIAYVEKDPFCQAVLRARMADGSIDEGEIFDDVTTFDGKPWRGRINLISGGFPCQDISNAGKRAGIDGERSGLWREYARLVREIRPRYVFVENVAALLGRGLGRVLGDLACLGYDAQWACLRASDIGAPMHRRRLWILAVPHYARLEGTIGLWQSGAPWNRRAATRCQSLRPDCRPWPPGPRAVGSIPRMVDGPTNRIHRLKALGNACVPLQACEAFRLLWQRMREEA